VPVKLTFSHALWTAVLLLTQWFQLTSFGTDQHTDHSDILWIR